MVEVKKIGPNGLFMVAVPESFISQHMYRDYKANITRAIKPKIVECIEKKLKTKFSGTPQIPQKFFDFQFPTLGTIQCNFASDKDGRLTIAMYSGAILKRLGPDPAEQAIIDALVPVAEHIVNTFLSCASEISASEPIAKSVVAAPPVDPLPAFKLQQEEFLESLTDKERYLLATYTKYGNVMINYLLRSVNTQKITKLTRTFMSAYPSVKSVQDNSENPANIGTVPKYLTEFYKVTQKAPVLKEELTVYRGITSEKFIPTSDETGYLSTSLDRSTTESVFAGDSCCMLTIHLKPGVRVIWMEPITNIPGEDEVLVIPPNVIVSVDKGGGKYDVTISPKAPYVRKAGTRRNKKKRSTKTRRWF